MDKSSDDNANLSPDGPEVPWALFPAAQVSDEVTFPPLAADDPLGDHFDPRKRRRRSWRQASRDAPSWLTSLVMHLIWFLLIATLTAPMRSSGSHRSMVVSLTSGFQQTSQSPEVVQVAQSPAESETVRSPDDSAAPRPEDQPEDQPVEQPPANPAAGQQSADQQTPAEAMPEPAVAAGSVDQPATLMEQWMRQAQRQMQSQSTAEQPVYSALLMRARRGGPVVTTHRQSTAMHANPHQQELDSIVDQFILYDVGKLRGTEGREALRKFMALGPEAVPALVRGLNKSAQIHASCPVGVIASRLITTLRQVQDPSLLQYTMDHLGRDVPTSAPHYSRIMALRDRWLANLNTMPQPVASTLHRRGMTQDGQLMELVLSLSDGTLDTVLAALMVKDNRLQAAAMVALLQRRDELSRVQRQQLIVRLRQLQDQAADDGIQELAGEVLQALE